MYHRVYAGLIINIVRVKEPHIKERLKCKKREPIVWRKRSTRNSVEEGKKEMVGFSSTQ